MIPISKIDPDLSIYRENTVVIWGAGRYCRKILKLLQYFQVEVSYICDSNELLWSKELEGISIISPETLCKYKSESGRNVVVQLAMLPQYEAQVRPLVEEMRIETILFYEECFNMLTFYYRSDQFSLNPHLKEVRESLFQSEDIDNSRKIKDHFFNYFDNCGIYVSMCGKTGDNTMLNTFRSHGIPVVASHYPAHLRKLSLLKQKCKIITAIREPVSRNISVLFQYLGDLSNVHYYDTTFFPQKVNDVQGIFEFCQDVFPPSYYIEGWFNNFSEHIVDVRNFPFDQEKGYTIIQDGGFDIFFYQLEKLNDLIPELSEWAGVPFTELINGNEASQKWIAPSYKRAKKELTFSQAYFDACYNDPYVQHCYSQSDIEKFKERWRGQIDPNK